MYARKRNNSPLLGELDSGVVEWTAQSLDGSRELVVDLLVFSQPTEASLGHHLLRYTKGGILANSNQVCWFRCVVC